MKELFKRWVTANKNGDTEELKNVIIELMDKDPNMIRYFVNKADSCFGEHKVYLVVMDVNGIQMIKLGYTKHNNIKARFKEKRYSGSNIINIISIEREEVLQAKGAVDFESELKLRYSKFKIDSNLTLPGKNEFYKLESLGEMIKIYDELSVDFIDIVGIKSPN